MKGGPAREGAIERRRTAGEELANALSHGVGLVMAVAAAPHLLATAGRGDGWSVGAAGVFCVAVAALYLSSTLHHALPDGRGKLTFELVDRALIFVVIAGTYTPFAVGALRGPWGWSILGLTWGLAAAGIGLTIRGGLRRPFRASGLYLGMGWVGVLAARPLIARMPGPGVGLILAGGLAYTVGFGFYRAHRLRYNHLAWHLFVLLGTACHYLAILWYGV